MRALLVLTLLLSSLAFDASAADPEKPGAPAPANQASPPAKADESAIPEPEIVITTKGQDRYEEYRIGGRLYMIKVTPKVGKPYYLVDNAGRGEFVRSEFAPKVSPPMWIIKRF
jgi:hypothetical protein